MTELFMEILNMSIRASYVILAVILARLVLKKAPKKYSYALWLCAAFRLVCPVSFKSFFSLFALKISRKGVYYADLSQTVNKAVDTVQPQINLGLPTVNNTLSSALPETDIVYSANPMQVISFIAAVIWIVGMAILLIYSAVTYISLSRRLRFAVKLEDNIYQIDVISSPFIMGFIKPKIYIPYGLDADKLFYVTEHERVHLKRFDHIVKPAAFIILTVHWFNPLVWLAFYLMSRDMEMSCDEKVLSKAENANCDYSNTLLSLAVKQRFPAPSPLAFGESGVKSRIKNALAFKKPAVWISVIGVAVCVVAIFICTADPKDTKNDSIFQNTYSIPELIYTCGDYHDTDLITGTAIYYIYENGTVYHQSLLTEGAQWDELGTLENVSISEESFADSFVEDFSVWQNGYSLEKLIDENKNAWKFERDEGVYYILEQKNGEILYAAVKSNMSTDDMSFLGIGTDNETMCVRWIYRMEAAASFLTGDSYVIEKCLYMSALSSYAPLDSDDYRYIIADSGVLGTDRTIALVNRSSGKVQIIDVYGQWKEFPYSTEQWNEMFELEPVVDISEIKDKQWMTIGESALAKMDDELWLVDILNDSLCQNHIWSIYSLKAEK